MTRICNFPTKTVWGQPFKVLLNDVMNIVYVDLNQCTSVNDIDMINSSEREHVTCMCTYLMTAAAWNDRPPTGGRHHNRCYHVPWALGGGLAHAHVCPAGAVHTHLNSLLLARGIHGIIGRLVAFAQPDTPMSKRSKRPKAPRRLRSRASCQAALWEGARHLLGTPLHVSATEMPDRDDLCSQGRSWQPGPRIQENWQTIKQQKATHMDKGKCPKQTQNTKPTLEFPTRGLPRQGKANRVGWPRARDSGVELGRLSDMVT